MTSAVLVRSTPGMARICPAMRYRSSASVGDQDPAVPAAAVDAIEEAAAKAGVDLRVKVFAGAGHAFHRDARPASYHREAALEAWQDALSFLAETVTPGVAPAR
jgi:dienelactone hydrolase